MSHLWKNHLDLPSLLSEAAQFIHTTHDVGELNGPVLGDAIERLFLQYLHDRNWDVPRKQKTGADLLHLNVDIKSLQFGGRRGGAAKLHGYDKAGSPTYSVLLFGYSYASPIMQINRVFFIPSESIVWTRAHHYLFSVAERDLDKWELSE